MNPYKIRIDLPDSDGFHTRDNRHVAEIVQDRVQGFLDRDEVMGYPGCTVLAVSDGDPLPSILTAYDRLLSLHTEALLKHGPQVAQGLALAISTMNAMLPDSEKNRAVQGWVENTAAEAERASQ